MKRFLIAIIGFFVLSAQATLLPLPDVQTQGQTQTQGQAQSANANSVAGAIAGSAAISGSNSTSGSVAANTTSVHNGATTLNAGASNSATNVTISNPGTVETRTSGTTEIRTVAPVYAPDVVTTANCMIGASGGATGLGWGFAVGTGIEDKGCTRRENARLLKNLGKPVAAVAIMCNDPEVAAALGAVDCPPKAEAK